MSYSSEKLENGIISADVEADNFFPILGLAWLRRRQAYLLCFLLHRLLEERQAAADELLADHHGPAQEPGPRLHIRGPHDFVHQDADVLRGQTAEQQGLDWSGTGSRLKTH